MLQSSADQEASAIAPHTFSQLQIQWVFQELEYESSNKNLWATYINEDIVRIRRTLHNYLKCITKHN